MNIPRAVHVKCAVLFFMLLVRTDYFFIFLATQSTQESMLPVSCSG